MSSDEENQNPAEVTRQRSVELDRESQDMHWHPTEGKRLADEADATWNRAREQGDSKES